MLSAAFLVSVANCLAPLVTLLKGFVAAAFKVSVKDLFKSCIEV